MREIKFKVYDTHEKELYEIDGLWFEEESVNFNGDGLGSQNKGRYKLLQCTGIRDKNGVDIYEGDIIRFISNGIGDGIIDVKWNYGQCGFAPFCEQILGAADSYSEWELIAYKVIGNIYENPELLK